MMNLPKLFLSCLLIFWITLLSNDCIAQVNLLQRLSLREKHASLKEALNIISEAAGVDFAYNTDKLPLKQVIFLFARDEGLDVVLQRITTPLDLEYKVIGKTILITGKSLTKKSKNQTIQYEAVADPTNETYTIKGFVFDEETNRPLEGVIVSIGRYHIEVRTDKNGKFLIRVPNQ